MSKTTSKHRHTSSHRSAAGGLASAVSRSIGHGNRTHRLSRRQRITAAVLALGSVLAGALVAHALWSAQTTMAAGVVIAGDLNAKWQPDSLRWTETNDWAKAGQLQSGTTALSLHDHRLGPGSKLKIEYDFTITGHGDNLDVVATLTTGAWSVRPGWVVSWTVVDSDGLPVSGEGVPQAAGTPLVFGPIHPDQDSFTFQLFVEVPVSSQPPFATGGSANTHDAWYLGKVTLSVDQVRGWGGED